MAKNTGLWVLGAIIVIVLIFIAKDSNLFATQTQFTIVGRYRGCDTYKSTSFTEPTGSALIISPSDYSAFCSSGNALLDLYFGDGTIKERKNSFTGTCSVGPCTVDVYCCSHPECTSDSECKTWTGYSASQCLTKSMSDGDVPTEDRNIYSYSSFNYCTTASGTMKSCYWKTGNSGSCQSREYMISQLPGGKCEGNTYGDIPPNGYPLFDNLTACQNYQYPSECKTSGQQCVASTPSQCCAGLSCQNSFCAPTTQPICGDGNCNGNENAQTCPQDCNPNGNGDYFCNSYTFSELLSNSGIDATKSYCLSECNPREGYTVKPLDNQYASRLFKDNVNQDCQAFLTFFTGKVSGTIVSLFINVCDKSASVSTLGYDLLGIKTCYAESSGVGKYYDGALMAIYGLGIPKQWIMPVLILGVVLLLMLIISMFK